jgi:hypothetical protein
MTGHLNKVVNEVLTKDTPASKVIKDFIDSDNPKFAGKSKEKRKQMALAAYYAKQRNEGTIQPSGSDKIEVAGNELPANNPKGKTVKQFKFFATEEANQLDEIRRPDSYTRDYNSSVSGMGKRQSAAYHADGGANDEGWDNEKPSRSSKPADHPHAVHINGKKWKTFGSQSHASNVAKKIKGATVHKEEFEESYDFDSAAMAKQELSDAKNKKHRGRGKVANLLRRLGMREEIQSNTQEDGKVGAEDMNKFNISEEQQQIDEISKETAKSYVVKKMDKIATTGAADNADKVKKNIDAMQGAHERIVGAKPTSPKKLKEFIETLKEGKAVDVNKVNAAGQEPHEEEWKDAKKKEVKKESYTVDQLLIALKEGMWPGTPEYNAKFGGAKQGGGAGIKKGSRYGGTLQKDEPDHDEEDEPKKAGRKVGSKSGARSTGTSKLINKQ